MALAIGQPASIVPETVVVASGKLHLKCFPLEIKRARSFSRPFYSITARAAPHADQNGRFPNYAKLPNKLAPLFLKHGYAFLYLFRRGQGLSADQGPFMQDILRQEEAAKGKEARQHLQFMCHLTDHLDDVMAALSFLKTAPAIDAKRIAIAGHSFGRSS